MAFSVPSAIKRLSCACLPSSLSLSPSLVLSLCFSILLAPLPSDQTALRPCYWAASCKQELYTDPSGNHLHPSPRPPSCPLPFTLSLFLFLFFPFFSLFFFLGGLGSLFSKRKIFTPKKSCGNDSLCRGWTAGYVPCSS